MLLADLSVAGPANAIGVATVLGAAFAVARSAHISKTVATIKDGNEELRAELADERVAREREGAECTRRLESMAHGAALERADLAAKIGVLTSSLGRDIATAVLEVVDARDERRARLVDERDDRRTAMRDKRDARRDSIDPHTEDEHQ